MKISLNELKVLQNLSLKDKIDLSQERITEWYEAWDGEVYVSFSGGKDSTVLLSLVRNLYPEVPAVFMNTGLEWPEVLRFVKTIENVIWVRPKMPFHKVVEKYGYPVGSKRIAKQIRIIQNPTEKNIITRNLYLYGIKGDGSESKSWKLPNKWRDLAFSDIPVHDICCDKIKKEPVHRYEKESKRKPLIGTMAKDSFNREQGYLKTSCNSFDTKKPKSLPISFWTEEDIWEYIKEFNISYSKIYDMGHKNTGCMFCMFGVHLDKGINKFQLMKQTHPKQWEYCIKKLGCGKVLDFIDVPYE